MRTLLVMGVVGLAALEVGARADLDGRVGPPLLPDELPAWRADGESASGVTPSHPVRRVLDGRTLVLEVDGHEVEVVLRGVALPSLPGRREHPYLGRSHEALRNLALGEFVRVDPPIEAAPLDGGERPLIDAYRQPDGLLLNLELVREGVAKGAPDGASEHGALFELVERRAKQLERGMWNDDWVALVRTLDEIERDARPASSDAGASSGAGSGSGAGAPGRSPDGARGGVLVFATSSGSKYHAKGCRYADENGASMTIEEAKRRGLAPCKVCKPG